MHSRFFAGTAKPVNQTRKLAAPRFAGGIARGVERGPLSIRAYRSLPGQSRHDPVAANQDTGRARRPPDNSCENGIYVTVVVLLSLIAAWALLLELGAGGEPGLAYALGHQINVGSLSAIFNYS
jgi:hypothetical protein